jgi:4'-phosphopantetheinyl transferase EntD
MVGDIFPPRVAVAEVFGDLLQAELFPDEEEVVAQDVALRRREFTTGRSCARTALAKLGVPPVSIVPGLRGAPQWPSGVVGSITHCAGYRASAVARERDIITIGFDAEPHDTLPGGVLEAIACRAELANLDVLAATRPQVCWDRALLSAKKSVYKAWFPLTRCWLKFQDVAVDFNPGKQTFIARLLVDSPLVVNGARLTGFEGRWAVSGSLIVTTIAVPRRAVRRGHLLSPLRALYSAAFNRSAVAVELKRAGSS